MARIKFTSHLKRFFPTISEIDVKGTTVAEVVSNLDSHFPGITDYIINEHGKLRQHVNIFIGEELIVDREKLQDSVSDGDRVYIFQALSGG